MNKHASDLARRRWANLSPTQRAEAVRPAVALGGRPKVLVACESCGAEMGTAEMRAHKCGEVGYIYALSCSPGYIKIGFSNDPESRYGSIKRGGSQRPADAKIESLKPIGYTQGTRADESGLHLKAAPYRAHGKGREWYRDTTELRDVLASLGLRSMVIERDPMRTTDSGEREIQAPCGCWISARALASLAASLNGKLAKTGGKREGAGRKRCECGKCAACRKRAISRD